MYFLDSPVGGSVPFVGGSVPFVGGSVPSVGGSVPSVGGAVVGGAVVGGVQYVTRSFGAFFPGRNTAACCLPKPTQSLPGLPPRTHQVPLRAQSIGR